MKICISMSQSWSMKNPPSQPYKVFLSPHTINIILDNNRALRDELEMLKDESLFQGEELAKYQRHCISLADEVKYSCPHN
jgi:hypothetical protein